MCVHIYIYIYEHTYVHVCILYEFPVATTKKSLQSCWLKTIREMSKITDVFPLFLEGKGQKSRCAHARTPSGDSGGQSVPPLPPSRGLRESLGLWLPPSHLCLHLHMASPISVCPSLPLPSKDTRQWTEPSANPYHFTLHNIYIYAQHIFSKVCTYIHPTCYELTTGTGIGESTPL